MQNEWLKRVWKNMLSKQKRGKGCAQPSTKKLINETIQALVFHGTTYLEV
jgi:hypothetical protein